MRKFRRFTSILLASMMMITPLRVNASNSDGRYVIEDENSNTEVEDYPAQEQSDGSNNYDEPDSSYGYDSIVEEAEKEQEYRDSVDYVDNTIVFSVLDYRVPGEDVEYLKDSDEICKNNNLKSVTFILDTKKTDVEQKDGYTAYQVFYTATIKSNDIWQVVDQLSMVDGFLTVEPDYIWEKTDEDDMTEVNGETLGAEIECAGWSYADLNIAGIWGNLTQRTAPGEGVVVAVIDTGVDYNHIDLRQNMWVNPGEIPNNGIDDDGNGYIDDIHGINLIDPMKQGDPMDDHGHGTHVAGIIGMTAGNGGGVGIAYGSKIMAIKAGQASGYFSSVDIAKAVQYASVNGADVINMSFGGTGRSNLVEAALADAFGSCVLVASSGNDGLPTTDAPPPYFLKEDIYPAGYSYVLGVMACDSSGNMAYFSNWDYYEFTNCEYEMIAPGVDIFSALPGNRYARWSGTSMAAPMVSAAAAILRREYSDRSKYSSRYIMGQLSSATRDNVIYIDNNRVAHTFKKLNVYDSLNYSPKPCIAVSDICFFDGIDISDSNNKDGVVQAGETIDLGFLICNHWGIAKDVSISVNAKSAADMDDPYVMFIEDNIEIDDEVGTFGTINNGYRYDNDELVGVDNPIRMKISDDAPNDLIVTINYAVTAKNGIDNKDSSVYKVEGKYSFVVQRGTYLRGTINEDMTLTSEKLWIVDRALTINEGVTVNVDPGTKIQFYSIEEGPYAENHLVDIRVKGIMNFNGTVNEPIEVFPCKARDSFKVEIIGPYNVNMNYVKIRNPEIKIKTGNHLELSQDEKFVRGYENNGKINMTDLIHLHVQAEKITNSKFNNFTWYNGDIYSAFELDAALDTVLLEHNYMHFGSYPQYPYVVPYRGNYKKCVFLDNHNQTYNGEQGARMYLGHIGEFESEFTNNAILNDCFFDSWFKVCAYNDISLVKNYWGTTNKYLIEKMIDDSEDDSSFGEADYSNYLTLEDDLSSIYPFVTEAYITDASGEHRLSQVVNSQNVQVHVKFNRDMAQDAEYEPMVSFGPAEPFTDFVIDGDWVSAREWIGTMKIDPYINQGTQYIRIKDAAAADDLWLTTGVDAARFSFDITKSSVEALTLQGIGGSNENNLNWVQDDYDTLAGYNLYRATEYDKNKDIAEQGFVKINSSIIANDEKEYTDKDVEQGQDYYYYFTVVDTQFAESPASNVVKCTPLDEESPIISTNAIETKTVGNPVAVSADITDNVEVKDAELYYKLLGEDSWKQVRMRKTIGNSYIGVIPAYDIKEGTIQYYIEASDGTNITQAGSIDVPNVFSVIGIIDVESVSLDKTDEQVEIGETLKITATVLPDDATDKSITWASADESVAIVDEDGNVTTIGVGETTITATSADGLQSAICNIKVKPILSTELTIDPEEKSILVGDTFNISATIIPDNISDNGINYESNNINVATVDETGKVSAVGVGTADITVSTNDESGLSKVCKVTVNPIRVRAVSLSETSKSLDIGNDFTLIASVYPDNSTNKDVIWASSNPQVATVVDGKVTAIKGGRTIISAKTVDGEYNAICSVTVNSILTTDITLNKEELTLNVGEDETLEVTVDPENATSTSFTWKSDDKDIAKVQNGKITAVSPGKTLIKCTTTDGTDITKICSVKVYGKYDKPSKPVIQSKSATTVTIKPVDGALYSINGTDWVDSNEFTELEKNTEYSFYIKLKASGYYHESDISEAAIVTTDDEKIAVTEVILDATNIELKSGESCKITVSVEPDVATNKTVKWSSTNSTVATVDTEGNVTAKAKGTAYITCKSVDDPDKMDICTVKVYDDSDKPVITLNPIESPTEGTETVVSAIITNAPQIKEAKLYYRSLGEESWKQIKMKNTSDDTYKAIVPAEDIKVGTIQFYIEAGSGVVWASEGSEENPKSFEVKGIIHVDAISLKNTSEEMTVGETLQMEAEVLPENANNKSITWSSSDDKIVTVDDTGLIKAISDGEATIKVTSEDGSKSAICNITVKPILSSELSITPESKSVLIGDTFSITAEILPENTSNSTILFESSEVSIATVDLDGKVTAVGIGTTDITVSTNDGSGLSKICKVTVKPVRVRAVSLNETSKTLNMGEEFTLTAGVYPENATNKDMIWASSNPQVATVVDGKITAIKGGRTIISAKTVDGEFTAICNVTVTDILVTDITLNKEELTLNVGEEETLEVTYEPENATSTSFTWKSDDKDIAKVQNGKITAVSPGKTLIKCTTTDGTDITKICSVKVYGKYEKPAKPEVIAIGTTSITLKSIDGAVYSIDGTNWVDDNKFTGLKMDTEYSFYIKMKASGYYLESDVSDSITVKTELGTIDITDIILDQDELELMVGESGRITATIEPNDATIQNLRWNSTNSTVATVDAEGNVLAKGIGLAYIMCKSTDGSDIMSICTIRVYDQYDKPAAPEVVSVTENSITINAREGCEFRIDDGTWTNSPAFIRLDANTEYSISVRNTANGYHKASDPETITVKTNDHTQGEWETLKEATCTEAGIKVIKCTICGKTLQEPETIEPLGHAWDEGIITKSATDEEDGEILYTCTRCHETRTEVIVAGEHVWNEGEVIKEATCTEDGEILYTCTNEGCGKTKTESIPAKGHKPVIDPAVAPTCTQTGLSEGMHCLVCGEVITEQEEIAASGHTEVIDPAKPATYTEKGLTEGSHCSVCGEVIIEQETIDYLSGLYKLPSDGILYYMCEGKVNDTFTGIVKYNKDKKWYFVRNGKLDESFSGVAQATNGIWYYVTNGQIDRTFTGQIAKATNGRYYYVSKGKPTKNYDQKMAYCPDDKKYYYCSNGRVNFSFSGKIAYCTDGNWYYVKKGKIDTTFTGIAEATNGKLYYAKNGKLDKTYSGIAKYNGVDYKVVNGAVKQ